MVEYIFGKLFMCNFIVSDISSHGAGDGVLIALGVL